MKTLEESFDKYSSNIRTDRAIQPGVDVSVYVEHRGDVEVHVFHHVGHFWVCFVCLQDLI